MKNYLLSTLLILCYFAISHNLVSSINITDGAFFNHRNPTGQYPVVGAVVPASTTITSSHHHSTFEERLADLTTARNSPVIEALYKDLDKGIMRFTISGTIASFSIANVLFAPESNDTTRYFMASLAASSTFSSLGTLMHIHRIQKDIDYLEGKWQRN